MTSTNAKQGAVWIRACEEWMRQGVESGKSLYYVNIMFRRLPGSRDVVLETMKKAIERNFYGQLCCRFTRDPQARSQQRFLPHLWLAADLPVFKNNSNFKENTSFNAGGFHFNGPMLIAPHSKFEGDLVAFVKGRGRLWGPYIQRVHVVEGDDRYATISDYAFKTVKNESADADQIVILPRARSELRQLPEVLDSRSKLIKELQARFNISDNLAERMVG